MYEQQSFDALARIDCPPDLQSKWHNEVLRKILTVRVSSVVSNLMDIILA